MATKIKISDSAWQRRTVTLGGTPLSFDIKFNDRDKSWYLDIYTIDRDLLIGGIKVMPNQNLTHKYRYLNLLPDGDLWCIRTQNDFSPIDRTNLGINKTYTLVWINYEEQENAGIYDTVQL